MKKILITALITFGIVGLIAILGLLGFSYYLLHGDAKLTNHQLTKDEYSYSVLFPKNAIRNSSDNITSLAKDKETSLVIVDKVNSKRLDCEYFGGKSAFRISAKAPQEACRVPCDRFGKDFVCYSTQVQSAKDKFHTFVLFGKNVDSNLAQVKSILSSIEVTK